MLEDRKLRPSSPPHASSEMRPAWGSLAHSDPSWSRLLVTMTFLALLSTPYSFPVMRERGTFDLLLRLCPRSCLPVLFGHQWPKAWLLLSAQLLFLQCRGVTSGGMSSILGVQGSPLLRGSGFLPATYE